MIAKGVILAAGLGSRLCPLTPFLPKEMLPIGKFPAIHHILAEMADAGIGEVMIVLSRGKEMIRSYCTAPIFPKGEEAMRLSRERDILLSRVKITFVEQRELKGTADAIYLARDFMGEHPVLVAYPDDILSFCGLQDQSGTISEMIDMMRRTGASVLLSEEIPGELASQYGVLRLRAAENEIFVDGIEEKPMNYSKERAFAMIGRMLLTPQLVNSVSDLPMNDAEGIIPALNQAAHQGALMTKVYAGKRYDIGSHDGYQRLLREISEVK